MLLRIRALGEVASSLPDSPERAELHGYARKAARELIDWIDPANRAARQTIRTVRAVLYLVGIVGIVGLVITFSISDFVVSFWLGVAVGAVIAPIQITVEVITDRRLRRKREENERVARLEATRATLGLGSAGDSTD